MVDRRPIDSSSVAVAALTGGAHHGPEAPLTGVALLADAGPGELAYAEGRAARRAGASRAGALLVKAPVEGHTCVVVADPKLAFVKVLRAWYPEATIEGVHPTAAVDGALGEGVAVGAFAVIEAGARVGAGAVIHAGAHVGAGCEVGPGAVIFPRAVLYPGTVVGAGCRIHAGVVLGSDGFSYHPTAGGAVKVPQLGRVVIGDGVEIGANATVDRAFLTETSVGAGSALDNLVHVGHNSRLGRGCMVAAQVGFSGSVTLGDGVIVGGQAGFADHVTVGDGAMLSAQCGVARDLEGGKAYFWADAMPARLGRRVVIALRDLPEMRRLVYKMARRMGLLEGR